MKAKSVEEILSVLTPVADEVGVEIVEVEFKTNRDPHLTVYIDRKGGVDLDCCEKFHWAIDPVLDELDPTFGEGYTLNVSSPGLDRPFKSRRDFERCMGEKVEVKLYAPLKGKKFFTGVLEDYDGNSVSIDTGKEKIKFNLTQVAKVNRAIEIL